MPPIDRQQDWHLTNAGEENGHTMMEFHRLLKTGDTQDLDIPVSCIIIVQQDNQSQDSLLTKSAGEGDRNEVARTLTITDHLPHTEQD